MRGVSSEEMTQAKLIMQGVEQRIGAEARDALQSYKSALAKLNAARHSRQAAEAVYASEVRQFHRGESTTFLVLQRQVQLAEARGLELQAQTQLNQSIVELQRVDGSILYRKRRQSPDAWNADAGALDDGEDEIANAPRNHRRGCRCIGDAAATANLGPVQRRAAAPRGVADGDSVAAASPSLRPSRPATARRRPSRAIPDSSASRRIRSSESLCKMPSGWRSLKNTDLAVSASNVRIARYRIVQAKSNFDVHLQVQPSSSFSVTPPENLFFAGPGVGGFGYTCTSFLGEPFPCSTTGPGYIVQHQYSFQSGVGGQGANGTQYSASITQIRTYNNTIINTFNPYYQAILNLSVTQPLLKNSRMNAVKRQLKLSFVDTDSSEAQALVDASNAIAQVEDAYWDLVAGWRNVAIQEAALKQAVEQQQSVVRLAQRGVAPPITAAESQTQVSNFQSQVFSALQSVSHLQIQLKGLIVIRCRRSDLARELGAVVARAPTARGGRSCRAGRVGRATASGGSASRRSAPDCRHRSRLCEGSSAAAS